MRISRVLGTEQGNSFINACEDADGGNYVFIVDKL